MSFEAQQPHENSAKSTQTLNDYCCEIFPTRRPKTQTAYLGIKVKTLPLLL